MPRMRKVSLHRPSRCLLRIELQVMRKKGNGTDCRSPFLSLAAVTCSKMKKKKKIRNGMQTGDAGTTLRPSFQLAATWNGTRLAQVTGKQKGREKRVHLSTWSKYLCVLWLLFSRHVTLDVRVKPHGPSCTEGEAWCNSFRLRRHFSIWNYVITCTVSTIANRHYS
jgi:hypothetical protein